MEKFLESLKEASEIIQTADHLIYITFPLVKDKRLLFKVLLQAKTATTNCINSILQYEYIYKRVKLYQDPKLNFKVFREKCALRYGITEQEIELVLSLFDISEKHKKSPFEFVKNDKVVILSENMRPQTITVEKVKEFVILSKSLLKKARERIGENLR